VQPKRQIAVIIITFFISTVQYSSENQDSWSRGFEDRFVPQLESQRMGNENKAVKLADCQEVGLVVGTFVKSWSFWTRCYTVDHNAASYASWVSFYTPCLFGIFCRFPYYKIAAGYTAAKK
jgi:hypothetical protein